MMKKLLQLCFATIMLIGMSTNVSLADCCGQSLNPDYTELDCGEFELCLDEAYENCPITNIWTMGLPNINWPRDGRCITMSGFQEGEVLNFFLMVGVTGCGNYFEEASYTVTSFGCGPDPCCDLDMELGDAESTGECGEFKVCVEGLDGCDVSGMIVEYNTVGTETTHRLEDNCVVFSNLDIGGTFNYSITVRIDGCDDVILEGSYEVTEEGCDVCCLPPDINAVEITRIPGWNWIKICMPEAPCPDQEGLLYGLSFLKQCDEEPGIYSITASRRSCLYLRFEECCTYTFSAGYRSDDCPDVLWSQEVVWEAPCDGVGGGGGSSYGASSYEELPAELRSEMESNAVVSPNPFTKDFQIQMTSTYSEAFELIIFDQQGKMVSNSRGQLIKGLNRIEVQDLENVQAGLYFYQLISKSHRISDKVVKL